MEERIEQTIVVAMGGNALARHGEHGTYQEQKAHAEQLASVVRSLLRSGYRVLVTHGNGPQEEPGDPAGEGSRLVPPQPLSVLSAMTQGQIGHLLVTAITGAGTGPGAAAVSVTTHTSSTRATWLSSTPPSPSAPFLGAAGTGARRRAWMDGGQGLCPRLAARRRVAGATGIIEAPAIRLLVEAGYVVVASGGGGIPVTRAEHGLLGAEAVVDKDLSAALLAATVGATTLMMLTDVDRVMLDFGSAAQRPVDEMTADQAERYLAEGQFPPGSMGPKITAAVRFLRGGGRAAIVTSPEQAAGTLGGTRIVLRHGNRTGEAARRRWDWLTCAGTLTPTRCS